MAKKTTPKQPAKPALSPPKGQKPAPSPVPGKSGAKPTANTGKPAAGVPVKPPLPVKPSIKPISVSKPVLPLKGDLGKPLVNGGKISAEMYAVGKGSRLCQSLMMALKYEGKPGYVPDEKYLKRFARYGWDGEEDVQARTLLTLWRNGTSKVKVIGQTLLRVLQQDDLDVTSYDPNVSYTPEQQNTLLDQADTILENLSDYDEDEIAFARALILDFRFGVDLTIDTVTTGNVVNNVIPSSPQVQSWITNWAEQPSYWTARIEQAYNAVGRTAEAFWQGLQSGQLDVPEYVQAGSSEELFRYIMGEVEFRYFSQLRSEGGAGLAMETVGTRSIVNFFIPIVNETPDTNYVPTERNIVHELGHVFDFLTRQYARQRVIDEPISQEDSIFRPGSASYSRNPDYGFDSGFQPVNPINASQEDWADSFLAWVYDAEEGFAETEDGVRRQAIFEGWLEDSMAIAYGRGNPTAVRDFIQQNYETQVATIQSPTSLAEIPSGYSYVPVLASNLTGSVSVIGVVPLEQADAIGRGDWYLVEQNGVLGFVPASAFDGNVPSDLPIITPADVNALTGRQYETYREVYRERNNPNNPEEITFQQNYQLWNRIRSEDIEP